MNVRDSKGYYERLGVDPSAPDAEIRKAYRRRVKALHPDSGRPTADATAFQAVTDAYAVLRDPRRRAEYDQLNAAIARAEEERRRSQRGAGRERTESRDSGPAKPEARSGAQKQRPPPPEQPQTARPAAAFAAVHCDRCDRIPAQPRYVVFLRIVGRLYRGRRTEIAGVFCRRCADIVALKCSLTTWLLGWWSLTPFGPFQTLRALAQNLVGGLKPADQNARVLARQARAFYGMGRPDIAGNLALQSYALAPDGEVRRIIEITGATRQRRLKDRWRLGGWGFLAQALPIGLLIAVLIVELSAFGRWVGVAGADRIQAWLSGEDTPAPLTITDTTDNRSFGPDTRFVVLDGVTVHEGPDAALDVVSTLNQGDLVEVVGTSTAGGWLAVETAEGLSGYVRADTLTPGRTAKLEWCREGVTARPQTGSVLQRHAVGIHELAVVNRAAVDALVKLRDRGGQTMIAFFVRSNSKAEVGSVPEGTFTIDYATGTGFSRRCGMFVEEMAAWSFAEPLAFGAPDGAPDVPFSRQIALGAAGPAGQPVAIRAERFTID